MMKILGRLIIVWASLAGIARAETCAHSLAASGESAGILAYLNTLVEERILSLGDLSRISEQLEAGGAPENSWSRGQSTAARIHYREIENYLSQSGLDRVELRDWIRAKIALSQKLGIEREAVRHGTQYRRMEFIRVESKGDFKGTTGHTFEVMDTPVTQAMWIELMGKNPSFHKDGSQALGDHPVESITWFSAAVFANRLSEKMGLKPYYDVGDDMSFDGHMLGWKAETGDLAILNKNAKLKLWENVSEENFVPPAEEGYRLPTATEILEIIKQTSSDGPAGGSQYAWTLRNSEGRTHPVGHLNPPEGLEIFDFYGNVSEWQNNRGMVGYLHAGGFNSEGGLFRQGLLATPWDSAKDIGFRLVRTVK